MTLDKDKRPSIVGSPKTYVRPVPRHMTFMARKRLVELVLDPIMEIDLDPDSELEPIVQLADCTMMFATWNGMPRHRDAEPYEWDSKLTHRQINGVVVVNDCRAVLRTTMGTLNIPHGTAYGLDAFNYHSAVKRETRCPNGLLIFMVTWEECRDKKIRRLIKECLEQLEIEHAERLADSQEDPRAHHSIEAIEVNHEQA